jgi:cysteine synthase A
VEGTPGQVTGRDIAVAEARAHDVARASNAFYADQFNNPASVLAHEEGTGPEIWNALEGKLDAFLAMVGSGGTFVGTARYLKRRNPRILCAVVEPEGAEVLAGKPVTKAKHILQGAGYGMVPPLWEPHLADHFIAVGGAEAGEYRQRLASKEGLHVGFSSAANVCAAVKLLGCGVLGAEPVVVTVLPDTGLKY